MTNHNEHSYEVRIQWTGNLGAGTSTYRAYSRDHEINAAGKPAIPASSAPEFRGNGSRYNPEDLLIASLSACHMLWYLHLCADNGITVISYVDEASGVIAAAADGGGHFREVVLQPAVTLARGADTTLAERLHERAHALCFIANSVNFPVRCEPRVQLQ